jgi:hypothetical protein
MRLSFEWKQIIIPLLLSANEMEFLSLFFSSFHPKNVVEEIGSKMGSLNVWNFVKEFHLFGNPAIEFNGLVLRLNLTLHTQAQTR